MTRSIYQRTAASGVAALLALLVPAAALAETTPAMPAQAPATKTESSSTPDGSPALSKEQAIALVQRYFTFPDGPGKLTAELNNYGGRMLWQIMYVVREGNGTSGYGVGQVDARTGQILQANMGPEMRPIRTGPLGAPKDEAGAKEKAWALVKELFPDRVDALRPAPDQSAPAIYYGPGPSYDAYTFTWSEYQNEIPVPASSVSVMVDKYDLAYVGLSSNFQALKLPAAGKAIALEEAMKLFQQRMEPKLMYQPVWSTMPSPRGPQKMQVVYQMQGGGMIDAITGKFVDSTGREAPLTDAPEAVPAGTEPAVKPDKLPLTPESALAFATKALNMPEGGEVSTNRYPSDQGEVVGINWNEPGSNTGINLDMETGLIRNAYRNVTRSAPFDPRQPQPEVTPAQREQAKQAAIKLVQRYYSQLLGDLKLESQPEPFYYNPYNRTTFFFQRYVNGIPAGYDGVRVVIDPQTGDWSNFSLNWSKVEFPPVGATIDAQQVKAAFFAAQKPLLSYQVKVDPQRPPYGRFGPLSAQEPQEAMLVYQLSSPAMSPSLWLVDAAQGKPVALPGQAAALQESVEKELTGHWAEGELRFMLAAGALKPEELDVGRELTRGQLLQMMMMALQRAGRYAGYDPNDEMPFVDVDRADPLYDLVMQGYYLGFLKPEGEQPTFGADKHVTRAEFALWATRALGLDRLARTGLKTESGFTDLASLTPEQRNAVAFLEALGILKPEQTFRGSDPVWQGEGAALTVRLIQYLRSAR